MLQLSAEIKINDTTFNAFISIEAESSWQDLVDRCTIRIPNNFKREGAPITVGDKGFFKRGDSITISAGYFPDLTVIFEGYIRSIFVDTVVMIDCEDTGYLLKQSSFTDSFPKTTLKNLVEKIAPDIESESVDADLGQFRISRVTPLQVLEQLRKTYLVQSWFRGTVLRVGLKYYTDDQVTHIFNLEQNVIDSSGLEYIGSLELKMTVRGILQQGNKAKELFTFYEQEDKITISTEQPEGFEVVDEVSINEGEGEDSQETLELLMTQMLEGRLSTGVRGSFTTFLEPIVKHGEVAEIRSKKFPEKQGKFLIKRVHTTVSVDQGGLQEITIDRKVGNVND